jgi:hypothetical protein
VSVIEEIADNDTPNLKDAKLTGVKKGDDNETTVSLQKHMQQTRISVGTDEDGLVRPQSLAQGMRSFIRGVGLIK